MILLQGHAMTLTFMVATHILRVHIVHIATYACTNKLMKGKALRKQSLKTAASVLLKLFISSNE